LLLFPIVLGRGQRFFESWTARLPLRLVESQTLGSGVLSLTYQPASE
jgi:hypothetical protein